MPKNNSPKESNTTKPASGRLCRAFLTAVSFWKPIERCVVPTKEQLDQEQRETKASILSSDEVIKRSEALIASLGK